MKSAASMLLLASAFLLPLSRTSFAATTASTPAQLESAPQIEPAQPDPGQPGGASTSSEDTLYAQGTKAMDEQRWADAVSAFDRVIAAKGKRADAAMYWKAYSLNKLGRKDESRAVCNELRSSHHASTWNHECLALQIRAGIDPEKIAKMVHDNMQMDMDFAQMDYAFANMPDFPDGGPRVHIFRRSGQASEDDIKILALNSLIRQDPAKALPMLRDLLHSDKSSPEMKRQALFVLSRSKEPEAQNLIADAAKNSKDPSLQRAAVEMLAVQRGKDCGPSLLDIYRGTPDPGVKRAAVNGLYLIHDAPRLVELARAEKDLNLKRDIVSQLALMKDPAATDYMLELLK